MFHQHYSLGPRLAPQSRAGRVLTRPASRYARNCQLAAGLHGDRDSGRADEAIEEIRYLLDENPLFFGGQKILAFLLHRQGDLPGAGAALHRYLELHPRGIKLEETRSLVDALQENGTWP